MCGIIGAYNTQGAASFVYLGLHGMQHRAKEFAGCVSSFQGNLFRIVGEGIAQDVFTEERLAHLRGPHAIGHIRYSTVTDAPDQDNAQPILYPFDGGEVALAHNGNLTNVNELRAKLPEGRVPKTNIDTELILLRLLQTTAGNRIERIRQALTGVLGSYSLLFLFPDELIAVRDPSGNRPLSLLKRGDGYFVVSESCALQGIAEFVRDIEADEIVSVSERGIESFPLSGGRDLHQCMFELVYFAHPGSTIFGRDVHKFRVALGRALARCCPAPNGEVVIGVPASGRVIARGYADESGIPCEADGLSRNHYIGRTFLNPTAGLRNTQVQRKFMFVPSTFDGRSVVLIDDSIVRLNTLPPLVARLKTLGAREVHARIAFPPFANPCRYGIDTPTAEELGAASMSLDEMRVHSHLDSLDFLPLDALRGLTNAPNDYCFACVTGKYWDR